MLEICKICKKKNSLNYYSEKPKILSCNYCKSFFRETEFDSKQSDFIEHSKNPTYIKKIKKKLTGKKFWKLVSDRYIEYLKEKTDMRFESVLDIGSFYGSFVKSLNDLGINAEGIEADQLRVKLSVTDKIKWGYFDTDYITSKKYDLICFTQVIYYFKDTLDILNHAKKMLAPNGKIFISTLNPESTYYHEHNPFRLPHANMMLGKKIYKELDTKLKLKLIDYTEMWPSMFVDSHENKIKLLKYFLNISKPYRKDPNGFHVCILLENTL